MAASSSSSQHHNENLPQPHRLIWTYWDKIREACEKSKAEFNGVKPRSLNHEGEVEGSGGDHLMEVSNVENLFLMGALGAYDRIGYWLPSNTVAHKEEERTWGSKDMVIDFGCVTPEQRIEYLGHAANFSGGAVHLLDLGNRITQEEMAAWVEVLSHAADRSKSLLISRCSFDPYDILNALKRGTGLTHLSLQRCPIRDDCIEVFCGLGSLTSLHLHLYGGNISPEFVGKLADLRPSHSPLAASLQRLYISTRSINWSESTSGFLQHWPQLKELTLIGLNAMTEEEVIHWMEHLSIDKIRMNEEKEIPPSTHHSVSSDHPGLFSITLGKMYTRPSPLSQSAIAAVVDALSRSGLPFLQLVGVRMDPAIEAQLERNRRVFMLGGLETVPATSMRLFICGDAYAGKTTLLSTMHSIYAGRTTDKLRELMASVGMQSTDRTQGIEVRAIEKDGVRLSLWDMAGQEEFHAFHDSMLPDIGSSSYQAPSLFMFVWSPRKSQNSKPGEMKTVEDFEESFRYWLKFLASKSRKSNTPLKVIMVFTRADQMNLIQSSLTHKIESLRSEFKEVIDIINPPLEETSENTTFEVDARKKDSVQSLAEYIFNIAKKLLQGVMVYDICAQVSKHLSKHLKISKQRIIPWSKFSEICKSVQSIPNHMETKILQGVASSLNEAGIIIYVNNVAHIVLDPNWFCNHIIGSLIHFPEHKEKLTTIKIHGSTNRRFLEDVLGRVTKFEVSGSLLVDFMAAMHLCCKVPNNHGISCRKEDEFFIPATLTNSHPGLEQVQWRSSAISNSEKYVYVGRRLECENTNLTFLTPGLFPTIQVLFNNAFQVKTNTFINLGKHFISIYVPNMEIVVAFCKAKSDYVIDVLVQATIDIQETLAYLQDNVMEYLITICAQPNGIQGVKLIESVIRPDSFFDLSKPEEREDQCEKITTLKENLREQLDRGEKECHVWKKTKHMDDSTTNSLIDILGSKNYYEVVMSHKAWLEEVKDIMLVMDDVNKYGQHESHSSVTMTDLEKCEDLEKGPEKIAIQEDESYKRMLTEIAQVLEPSFNSVKEMVAANHREIIRTLHEIHSEITCMREDVLSKVQKDIDKLLKFALESDFEKQLPRFVVLNTSDGVNNIRKLVTSLSGGHVSSVRVELCCEDRTSPHPVENQPGITITSLSEPLKGGLERALPYVNNLLWMLTTAAKLGIKSVIPVATAFAPSSLPHFKLPKEYLMISNALRFKTDTRATSSIAHLSSRSESFQEWQKCLALILKDKYGGATDQIIYDRFLLKRATYKKTGSNQVAWLCDKHYREQTPFSLG